MDDINEVINTLKNIRRFLIQKGYDHKLSYEDLHNLFVLEGKLTKMLKEND